MKTYRIQDYKNAKAFVDSYMKSKRDYAIIHYSCQGFYSTTDGKNPRIVAICMLFPHSMQKHLFSLTSIAEIKSIDLRTATESELDVLEQEMLKDFYAFVKGQKRECTWLHWNMRDHVFGFTAIAQRYCKLNGKKRAPYVFDHEKQKNIALLLKQRYGENYAQRPHLTSLLEKNKMNPKNVLSGAEEARAYEGRDFLAMERSLEDKVAAFSEILDKVGNNELKTESRLLRDIYGLTLDGIIQYIKEHLVLSLIGSIILEIILKLVLG